MIVEAHGGRIWAESERRQRAPPSCSRSPSRRRSATPAGGAPSEIDHDGRESSLDAPGDSTRPEAAVQRRSPARSFVVQPLPPISSPARTGPVCARQSPQKSASCAHAPQRCVGEPGTSRSRHRAPRSGSAATRTDGRGVRPSRDEPRATRRSGVRKNDPHERPGESRLGEEATWFTSVRPTLDLAFALEGSRGRGPFPWLQPAGLAWARAGISSPRARPRSPGLSAGRRGGRCSRAFARSSRKDSRRRDSSGATSSGGWGSSVGCPPGRQLPASIDLLVKANRRRAIPRRRSGPSAKAKPLRVARTRAEPSARRPRAPPENAPLGFLPGAARRPERYRQVIARGGGSAASAGWFSFPHSRGTTRAPGDW